MPKIITAHRREDEHQKAREYVRSYILLPSSLLGLVFMVAGMAALIYQFVSISFSWQTFLESVSLLLVGIAFGWAQTRYHRYLLREHPQVFAGRQRLYAKGSAPRGQKEVTLPPIEHRGRNLVPLWYVVGAAVLFGASAWVSLAGETYYVAAFLLPWMGFFWAKVYFWRIVLPEMNKVKGKNRT